MSENKKYIHVKISSDKKQSVIDALNGLSDDALFNFDDKEIRNNIVSKLKNLTDEDLKLIPSELIIMNYIAHDVGIKVLSWDMNYR